MDDTPRATSPARASPRSRPVRAGNQSRLPHQRLVERSIPGIENASPEQLIRADGVGACPLRDERQPGRWWLRFRFPWNAALGTGDLKRRPASVPLVVQAVTAMQPGAVGLA